MNSSPTFIKWIPTFLVLLIFYSCKQENQPPVCAILQPQNNADFTYGDEITISIEASDPDGYVHEVRLYINDVGVTALYTFPYNYVLQTSIYGGGEYVIKATASDSEGSTMSDQVTVIVGSSLPSLNAVEVSSITDTSAVSGGEIFSDGGESITARGICWSTFQNPTVEDHKTMDGTGTGEFISSLTGLSAETRYYIRAYATNAVGTAYGAEVSFITDKPDITGQTGTVTDVDGNTYTWIGIGTQAWMVQNLEVTHYNNGEEIPEVTSYEMIGLATGAYCHYNNDTSFAATYGKIYNYYSLTDSRKLCPEGWHIPDNAEWEKLMNHLGGINTAAGKLKETGTVHWNTPNTGATNETGFTALPGGNMDLTGDFFQLGNLGIWWSYDKIGYVLHYNSEAVSKYNDQSGNYGYYVRCIRDE